MDSAHTKRLNQSPTDGYDEDCYVIVTPHSVNPNTILGSGGDGVRHQLNHSHSSLTPLSPSYVRDMNLPRKVVVTREEEEAEGEGGLLPLLISDDFESDGDYDKDDKDEDSASSVLSLSLVDAGHVIRQEWMDSLQVLRRERRDEESPACFKESLPGSEDLHDKIHLTEVAYMEYKRKLRGGGNFPPTAAAAACGDYVDENLLQFLQLSSTNSKPASEWATESSCSSEEETTITSKVFGSFDNGLDQLFPKASHAQVPRPRSSSDFYNEMPIWLDDPSLRSHDTARTRSPRDTWGEEGREKGVGSEVIHPESRHGKTSLPAYRPRSRLTTVKPTITPRKKLSTPQPQSPQTKAPEMTEKEINLRPILGLSPVRKPIPVPRTPHTLGVKSSMAASMVTMGIGTGGNSGGSLAGSRSEDNLLDAISREEGKEEGRGGAWLGGSNRTRGWDDPPGLLGSSLGQKFHSSVDLSKS